MAPNQEAQENAEANPPQQQQPQQPNLEEDPEREFNLPEDILFVYKNYPPNKADERLKRRNAIEMPKWDVKDDIVVTGIAGRFPGLC